MASAMSGAKVLCSMATELLHEAKGEAILVESDVQTDSKTQVAFLGTRISIKEALHGRSIYRSSLHRDNMFVEVDRYRGLSPQHQRG